MTARPLVVFDLEFTAWDDSLKEGWLRPGEFKEVVQIGAVRLDSERLKDLGQFNGLVRPRINPRLSDYFESLTGITNARLEMEGMNFEDAYRGFVDFADGATIAAFGHDEWVLEENIRLYGLKGLPVLPDFLELRDWFARHGVDPKGLHSCDIGPRLGIPFEGQTHDALADSRSIAAGLAQLVRRGAKIF